MQAADVCCDAWLQACEEFWCPDVMQDVGLHVHVFRSGEARAVAWLAGMTCSEGVGLRWQNGMQSVLQPG